VTCTCQRQLPACNRLPDGNSVRVAVAGNQGASRNDNSSSVANADVPWNTFPWRNGVPRGFCLRFLLLTLPLRPPQPPPLSPVLQQTGSASNHPGGSLLTAKVAPFPAAIGISRLDLLPNGCAMHLRTSAGNAFLFSAMYIVMAMPI
jgi:hypothetical protein